jgi:hypothetical protein
MRVIALCMTQTHRTGSQQRQIYISGLDVAGLTRVSYALSGSGESRNCLIRDALHTTTPGSYSCLHIIV